MDYYHSVCRSIRAGDLALALTLHSKSGVHYPEGKINIG